MPSCRNGACPTAVKQKVICHYQNTYVEVNGILFVGFTAKLKNDYQQISPKEKCSQLVLWIFSTSNKDTVYDKKKKGVAVKF